MELAPRLVALGGGGYDLAERRARVDGGVGRHQRRRAARRAARVVRGGRASLDFRSRSLWDPAGQLPEHRHLRAQEYVARQIEAIRRIIFPRHGL